MWEASPARRTGGSVAVQEQWYSVDMNVEHRTLNIQHSINWKLDVQCSMFDVQKSPTLPYNPGTTRSPSGARLPHLILPPFKYALKWSILYPVLMILF